MSTFYPPGISNSHTGGGGGGISVVLKLEASRVHSVAHTGTDSEEAAFTFIQADSAA